jgi:flagellar biosynthesis GTPase FlhF
MTLRTGVLLLIMKSTRSDGRWMTWSLFAVWLAAAVLVVPARADEFSLTGCLAAGGQGGRIDMSRYFACYEAQREYEVRRYKEAAESERQRRAAEQRTVPAQAKETADQEAKEKKARQEAERTRQVEAAQRARQAAATERARKAAEEVEAARWAHSRQERPRSGAELFVPRVCPQPGLTVTCAMPQDPVLEQIRKSQENAARGRPSR